MASRGAAESEQLRSQVEAQLNRLLSQLEDLEELKEDLDEDEYEETKNDTIEQLKQFDAQLKKMVHGNMGLVTELASYQLAIQAAVSSAFQTPEVIRAFAKREPGQLRQRYTALEREHKLGKISDGAFTQQALELLTALKRLGQELSAREEAFLGDNQTAALASFEKVGDSSADASILSSAASQVKSAAK
eukprot:TRINITY_DN8459_c0_g1_i1.p1 TRINITY_DN8459_c0_g1~~TRINITY_DN8459_c0_g1_i1.p1  ORF type:complete len:190 (-),score=74.99 TRINITY_DN8459_c0_g1_i1:16-585(-)